MAGNNVGDQLDTTTLSHVEALDQGQGHSSRLDVSKHQFGQVLDELMGDHKDQDVGVLTRLDHIRYGHLNGSYRGKWGKEKNK